jgi:hypothetical protein
MFIRFSLGNLKLQQPQLPRSAPDGRPNESSRLALQVSEIGDRPLEPLFKPNLGRPVEHLLGERNVRLALAGGRRWAAG